jgi:hypothetical protein
MIRVASFVANGLPQKIGLNCGEALTLAGMKLEGSRDIWRPRV